MIVVHGLRANFSARENCAIAARNMEILAKSLGLGTCWAGFLLVAAGLTKKVAGRLASLTIAISTAPLCSATLGMNTERPYCAGEERCAGFERRL